MKTLFHHATFHSLTDPLTTFTAVLCEDAKIVATFATPPPEIDCRKIDLYATHVYPGFVDSHTHCFEGGLYSHGVDLSQCKTISDVLDSLAQATPFSDMVFAFKFDENDIRERRFPTIPEIDAIFPNTPLLLRRVDGHTCLVNTVARTMLPIAPADFPESGLLRGSQNDTAAHTFHKRLSDKAILQCYFTAQEIALKNGHSSIHTMIGDAKDDCLHFPLLLQKLNQFIIDFIPYPQCFAVDTVDKIYDTLQIKDKRVGGCILADGSFGSHTAALSQSYIDRPDCNGTLYQTQEFWDAFMQRAIKAHMHTGVHCIGDKAVMQIIDAIAKAHTLQPELSNDLRHQLIHCEYVTDEMIPLIANNHLYPVMQPMFDALWGGENGFYASVISAERVRYLNRFRSLTQAGITLCGGSDWYVTDLSALRGIDAAVYHHNHAERLTPFEAVKMYTTNPHILTNDEHSKGLIMPDFAPDFVCLDRDILSTDNIKATQVVYTIKNAEIVYTL